MRFIIITASDEKSKTSGTGVYASFEGCDLEGLKTYPTWDEAVNEARSIKRKWSYLHIWIFCLDQNLEPSLLKL